MSGGVFAAQFSILHASTHPSPPRAHPAQGFVESFFCCGTLS